MKLKIWHKMIIGISIPSFIVILGGLLSYQYLNDVKNRQGFVQIADNLNEQVLEIRRNEKNFLLHKYPEYFKYCEDAIHNFNSSVNSISFEIVEDIGKDDFALLGNSIQTYSDLIYNLMRNYEEETDVIERVREEGRKLETYVSNGTHPAGLSTDLILDLRRLEKNYMLFRDANSFTKFNAALLQLRKIKAPCKECEQYTGAIEELFSSYRKSDLMVNDLQVIGSRLEEITNTIANSERDKINSFITLTQRDLLIAIILLCTLGPLVVYKTATYIVTPINRLAEITREISKGDITLRAPIREHDETYSLAVSFNTMLDHLQLTQESLEKSMDLLREKQAQLVESKKLASIGTLAAGVAHELNNPLNNIYTTAQRLMKRSGDECPPFIRTGLDDIFGQTLRVKSIVGDLLEFARGREPHLMAVELRSFISGSYKHLSNTITTDNVRFSQKSHPDEIVMYADPEQLEQVFINLFANAVDAMSGEGDLTVEAEEEDAVIKIKVSDTGKGMSPRTLEKIFEPFYTTKDKGTGLGLAIVYNIIQKHHGEILVESQEGKGTAFIITLPKENV